MNSFENLKIAVAGTGYVGLSIATLLSQHHKVTAVDVLQEKVDLINQRRSPIQDEYIEKFLAEKELSLQATTDAVKAYAEADFEPENGEAVCAADEMKASLSGHLLRVQMRHGDEWTNVDIALRSAAN